MGWHFLRVVEERTSVMQATTLFTPDVVTHGVRRAPVNILLHASVLICRAETSVLENEVTVLS